MGKRSELLWLWSGQWSCINYLWGQILSLQLTMFGIVLILTSLDTPLCMWFDYLCVELYFDWDRLHQGFIILSVSESSRAKVSGTQCIISTCADCHP